MLGIFGPDGEISIGLEPWGHVPPHGVGPRGALLFLKHEHYVMLGGVGEGRVLEDEDLVEQVQLGRLASGPDRQGSMVGILRYICPFRLSLGRVVDADPVVGD